MANLMEVFNVKRMCVCVCVDLDKVTSSTRGQPEGSTILAIYPTVAPKL